MTDDERIARFVDAVKDDPRVLGVARLAGSVSEPLRLLLVTTWDGGESLPRELPQAGAQLLGGAPRVEKLRDPARPDVRLTALWTGAGADGSRALVGVRRIGDLVPSRDGRDAQALHDPHDFIATWLRYSKSATDAQLDSAEDTLDTSEQVLLLDSVVRSVEEKGVDWAKFDRRFLRGWRSNADPADPVQAALAARIDACLRISPGEATGLRGRGDGDPAAEFEAFLHVADDEGFKGDRVLFGEATKRLRDLSKREPVFDQGFVVPTFDAVEAAFALGEAVGGCQPPLIPGVYVGVGVTPTDALEFWAAPFVRDPTCSVACVDDAGERDVVERAAGRGPMVATLTSAVDAAWERLPALIDRARDAAKEQVDPSAVLAPLHLPKSFVERAKRRGARALMCSRLTVALAVARAGHDCAPLVARKFGLAAGRVLAAR